MRLILVRHAHSDPGDPDELRPLSARGREEARALGERLAPGAGADDVIAVAEGQGATVVTVGHQPDCSEIVLALAGTDPGFPPAGSHELDVS